MKTASIQSTNNYGLFVEHPNQQPISPSHVAEITQSMKEDGFWESKPVEVYKENGRLHLIDGHHRVRAAKEAGVFVYFVVVDKSHSSRIGKENRIIRKWQNLSFAKLYAADGNRDFQALLEYVDRGIPVGCSAALLRNGSHLSGYSGRMVVDGTFQIKTTKTIDIVLNIVETLREQCPAISKTCYIKALAMLVPLKEFEADTFIHKALKQPRAIVKCATVDQALDCIDEVYNHASRIKVHLKTEATELARARNKANSRANLKNAK